MNRPMELVDFSYKDDMSSAWPLTVYIQNHISQAIETWHVKYLLGSDGARSAAREVAGIESQS